jgi:APA family basic amino acid/polyamine antiporter
MTGDGLRPLLSIPDCISIVVGTVIGSAIFLVPSTVLAANPSPLAACLVFLAGGIVSFFGALAYAELGSMFPATGGEYVYLRESWGSTAAFLCGWSYFLVIQSGGTAAIAVGFASLVGSVLPLNDMTSRLCSVALLVTLTAANYRGIRSGAWTGNFFTACKLGGLLVMLAAVSLAGDPVAIDWRWPASWSLREFALALVPVLWAYEGWNTVTFVGGEMRNPRRTIPIAMAAGLGIVIVVYLASVWVYLRVLTVPEIVASGAVAPAAAMRALGGTGGTLVTLTMIAALVGAANASVLAAPRIYFAQARDGLLFRSFGVLHPVFRTPSRALILQCVWASVLSLTGSYEVLLSWCTFTAWVFYALCVAAVILLRVREPERPRSFRMPGYPWTALVFLAIATGFVLGTLVTRPWTSAAGAAISLAGIPFYAYWKRRSA